LEAPRRGFAVVQRGFEELWKVFAVVQRGFEELRRGFAVVQEALKNHGEALQ
jgi:hypothetical protein